MTLQEVREEHKEDEGDPHQKSQRKHEHRAMLMSEVEKRVRRAKVVIVRRTGKGE
jgi:flagellar biosynthesis protein FlhB